MTEYWANHYEDVRLSGKPPEEEWEDEDFNEDDVDDLDALEAEMADEANWEDMPEAAES